MRGGHVASILLLTTLVGCERSGDVGAPTASNEPVSSAVEASTRQVSGDAPAHDDAPVDRDGPFQPEAVAESEEQEASPSSNLGLDAELPATDDGRRALLAARRARGIAELQTYAAAGDFPHNHDVGGERVPYLLDRHGRLCAVAYLMASSSFGGGFDHDVFASLNDRAFTGDMSRFDSTDEGAPNTKRYRTVSALLKELARVDNQVRVADVRDGPLLRWILVSGFTQEECALIQPTYTYLACDDCDPGSEQRPVSFGSPTAAALEVQAVDRERIRGHLTSVVSTLRAATEESLARCLDRLRALDPDRF